MRVKIATWNVNGMRANLKKGFMEAFKKIEADIFGVQETKMQPEQAIMELEGYKQYWNSAERKGYSGTAVFTRKEPNRVTNGIGIAEHDHEGRVITLEYSDFYYVTVYTPNSKKELERLEYRMKWEDAFRKYVKELDEDKPVIISGDLNVAHEEIDLKNPKSNHRTNGFTDEERGKFSELLKAGFIDAYRYKNPNQKGAYTWWSYLRKARENNSGWRIDYFLISERMKEAIEEVKICSEIYGSDHCPVTLTLTTR